MFFRLIAALAAPLAALAALASPAAAQAPAAPGRSITVVTAAYTNSGGLDAFTDAFEAETGVKVNLAHVSMTELINRSAKGPTDVMFMPPDLMDEAAKAGLVKAGTRKRIGRSYQALAVRKGAKVPDISTVPKFIAALEGANRVMRSNPGPGTSRTADMIDEMFKRPEFAKVKTGVSPYGDGAAALARNEGDMAIQNISQIVSRSNLQVVGPVPTELGMYIDAVAAVAAKAPNPEDGQRFLDYVTQKGTFPLWYSRGFDPREGGM